MNSTLQEQITKEDYELIHLGSKKQRPFIIAIKLILIALGLAYLLGMIVGWISR